MKRCIILLFLFSGFISLIRAQECNGKKGIGTWTNPKAGNHWLDSLNLSWYYNWDFKPSSDYSGDLEFIPMIWGDYDYYINDATFNFIKHFDFPALLGFNEPDHKDQANMSVSRAIELWPKLESTGKRLGSPAMAGMAYQKDGWLDQFMTIAGNKGYRIDFICVHIYQKNFDVNYVLDYCRKTYEKYHRPIWITEWSLVNWDGTEIEDQATMEEQAHYLFDVIKALDTIEYVERNAWFAMWDGHWANMPWPMYMVDENAQKLTVIGETMRYVCERDSFYIKTDIIPTDIPDSGIKIYPNPFHESVRFIVSDTQFNIFEIFSPDGTRIFKKEINHNSFNDVNLESFGSGIYILKLISEVEIQTFKIIKL